MRAYFGAALILLAVSSANPSSSLPEMRMTPAEVLSGGMGDSQIGSSKLTGVHTRILFGDPSKAGFYSILLFVPSNTKIPAHSHRDDRMATIVSGEWHFGYGTQFNEQSLKTLPAGGVYSEPGRANHFARTANEEVVVQISGYGPTDTKYFNASDDPEASKLPDR